jgi:ribonuclease P protein component
VGFTVTKKVGNAVIRNRVRRRLKAVAAEVLADFARDGQDLVIIGRMATIKRSYAALKKDMVKAVRKLNASAKETENISPTGAGERMGGKTVS